MTPFEFTLVLASLKEFTDREEDALYEAGFDDALLTYTQDGEPCIEIISRRADDMEQVVRSAVADVAAAGLRVARVESPFHASMDRINRELQQSTV